MKTKVAINGFGRMGRLALRTLIDSSEHLECVQINERAGTAECAALLLEFDSVHGIWNHEVSSGEKHLIIDGKEIPFTNSPDLEGLGWEDKDIDIVLECTGAYRSPETLQPYFDQHVKKVLVACPVKKGALNIVYGVNDHEYLPDEHHLLTAASCTTNCLAPVVKVIQEKIGIKHGLITTIHDITNTQTIVDAPHKDLRRARANNQSLIPTSTGSATAITMIYPELKGRLNGLAVRVPLLNASLTDCVFELEREVSKEEVNAYFKEASENELKGILGYEERPLVSIDFKDDTRSSIIDALSTMVVDGTSLKVLAWYDNEIGYVNRMVDIADKVAKSL